MSQYLILKNSQGSSVKKVAQAFQKTSAHFLMSIHITITYVGVSLLQKTGCQRRLYPLNTFIYESYMSARTTAISTLETESGFQQHKTVLT